MRKTKTICTIGPASYEDTVLEQLVLNGMDIARFNFSHAVYEKFVEAKNKIIKLNEKYNKNVKILMDLQGPRMRVGKLPEKGIELKEGEEVIFSTKKNDNAIFIEDPYLHKDILVGHPIYLSNGDMELVVTKKHKAQITAKVIRGGILYSRKGVNLPETSLTTRSLTEKDKQDIVFGINQHVDYIALSFVKDEKDIEDLKTLLVGTQIQTIAKIELKQAISNLDKIINVSDLIMVARGDLGIETPIEELPLLQKEIIRKTIKLQKPSIVATQILMSMVNHYRPTRAEVSDIANAVFDGAWALMLSDETAFGKYPIESLQYLVKTIEKTEEFQQTKS